MCIEVIVCNVSVVLETQCSSIVSSGLGLVMVLYVYGELVTVFTSLDLLLNLCV